MASSIQYGPCTLAENNAATVIQKFWRKKQSYIGMPVPIGTIVSLLGRQCLAFKSRMKEGEPPLFINYFPLQRESPLVPIIVNTLKEWIDVVKNANRYLYSLEPKDFITSYPNFYWVLCIANTLLQEYLLEPESGLGSGKKLHVVFDENNEIQAVALYTIDEKDNKSFALHLKYLCTAPHNLIGIDYKIKDPKIYTYLNPKNKPMLRGCGTALIEFGAFECIKSGLSSISLSTVDSAVEFYKKLGFKINSYTFNSMIMSAKAVVAFMYSQRCGRAKILYDVKEP